MQAQPVQVHLQRLEDLPTGGVAADREDLRVQRLVGGEELFEIVFLVTALLFGE